MKILRHFFRLSIDACLRRCNAFDVGELLFFAGPKKSNQKKGPSAQEHTIRGAGSRDFPTRHPWLGRKTARVLRAALRVLLRTAIQKLLAARATACLVLAFAHRAWCR